MESTTSNTFAASCLCTCIEAVLEAAATTRVGRLVWGESQRPHLRTSHLLTASSDDDHAVLGMLPAVSRRLAALSSKG